MEGTKPRMPCVHTGDVSCLFWWQHETGVTAGTLFTLNVCQAGVFPAGTTGPTPPLGSQQGNRHSPVLKSPSVKVSQEKKVGLEAQFENWSEGHMFGEARRRSLCESQASWWRKKEWLHVTFREDDKTARRVEGENGFCYHWCVHCPSLVWPAPRLAVRDIVLTAGTAKDCRGRLLPKKIND